MWQPQHSPNAERPSLVGRQHELDLLLADLPNGTSPGFHLHLVVGEPGVGKTRLVREVAHHAVRRGVRTIWSHGWQDTSMPAFWPWTQVVRQLVDRPDAVDLAGLVSPARTLAGRFALFDATAQALERAARDGPVLVVLDDLHRADPDSVRLLDFLAVHAARAELTVLVTMRDQWYRHEPSAAPLHALPSDTRTLHLSGLTDTESANFLGDRYSADAYALTRGNPLFLEQIRRSAPHVSPHHSLAAVLRTRMSALDLDTVAAMAAIAVLGPRATADAVAQLNHASEQATGAALERATEAGFVDPAAPLQLAHPLIAEVAVTVLPPEHGRSLHGRAADLLRGSGASAAELAEHLMRAGPHRAAEAIAEARAAAAEAASAMAHDTALEHHRRVVDLLVDTSPDDLDPLTTAVFDLAGAVERVSGRIAAEPHYRRARDLAEREGSPRLRAIVAARHGISYYLGGDYPAERVAECREALALLDRTPSPDAALVAHLQAWIGAGALAGIDVYEARAIADRAVATARLLDDPRILATTLIAQQVADLGPRTLERRLITARQIINAAITCRDTSLEVHGRFLLKAALLERGDIRELDAQLSTQQELITRAGEHRFTRHWLWFHCTRAMLDGDPAQVERLATDCATLSEELADPDGVGLFFGQLGVARWLQGRLSEMDEAYLDRFREEPDEPLWPTVLAWSALHQGHRETARGLLSHFAPPRHVESSQHTLLTLCTMADVVAAVGTPAAAHESYDALLPYADRVVPIAMGAACFGPVARPLGALALRLGHTTAAIGHYERAIAVATRLGGRPWAAEAQLALAALLLDESERAEVDAVRRQHVHHATRLVAEARGTLAGRGVRVFDAQFGELDRRLATLEAQRRPMTVVTPLPAVAPGRVKVRVLGGFEVVTPLGTTATWTSRKARTLLKMLLARGAGGVIGREEAMAELWPGEPPERLSNRLNVAVSTVRRTLDPERRLPAGELVIVSDDGIRLDRTSALLTVEVDAEVLLDLGRAAIASGDPEQLRTALAHYAGPPFPEEPFASWAEPLRAEVLVVVAEVLRLLTTQARAAGQHRAAADHARQLLELDPLHETGHRELISSLRDLGAHGLATTATQAYREAMGTIGVEPDATLVADPGA